MTEHGIPNDVELLGTYGGDATHACSAWTSTTRDLDVPDKNGVTKRERIPAMLKMLAENGHETPFEKSAIHFLVTSEKASHIHLIKHRIGVSVNAESARYKELKGDRWYTPVDWPEDVRQAFDCFMGSAHSAYHAIVEQLVERGYTRSRAKESARFILPHASMVDQDVQFNFRSFINFLRLRLDSHAQLEVQALAWSMLSLVRATGDFNHSLDAFGYTQDRIYAEHARITQLFELPLQLQLKLGTEP